MATLVATHKKKNRIWSFLKKMKESHVGQLAWLLICLKAIPVSLDKSGK
jgi:hypothetical protein